MAQVSIGEIQLLIGQNASVEREGVREPLSTGSNLYEGDSILTGDNTRLHIRFVDNAIAALRPNTEYQIECYQTDPQIGVCLKLNLMKGEVRQVSGQAGKFHKDRFRLNTPIAAIGIRGTDFVTRTGSSSDLVRVLSGEVVAAPFDDQCSSSTLGPCDSGLSRSLKASDGKIILIEPGKEPQFILEEIEAIKAKEMIGALDQNNDNANKIYVLSDNSNLVSYLLDNAGYIPDDVQYDIPNTAPIVFGTWSNEADGIAQPYPVASKDREITIGTMHYGLWRAPLNSPVIGRAEFSPVESNFSWDSATFLSSVELLDSSKLSVDFDQSQASVHLDLDTSNGLMTIDGASNINREDGIFIIKTTDNGQLSGAVTEDLSSAGTLLSQPVVNGILNGQILWAK